ncbi:hypothetical protein FRC12_022917 [Ceratobasidium sp. 428]|nr:hypothetical protein FRC12_022917 [Ceratobasidium sp. 428]
MACPAYSIQPSQLTYVTTRFIIESTKKLQPDPTEQSAATLLSISRTLVAISNGQSVPLSALPDPGSPQFTPPRSSVLINVLWLSSLTISVGVSLMAMLAKKWCHVFLSARTGSYHGQARRRQKRWDGIVWWRMRGVMDGLPLLMHLALALFAIGLVVYLWDINTQVAVAIVVIASAFGVAYGIATVLPFVFDTCPFGTVFSEPLKPFAVLGARILAAVVVFLLLPLFLACSSLRAIFKHAKCNRLGDIVKTVNDRLTFVGRCVGPFAFFYHERVNEKPADEEPTMDTVTSSILAWLIKNSENRDHVSIALQAISAASIELPMAPLRIIKAEEVAFQQLEKYVPTFGQSAFISPTSSPKEVLLLSRALSHLLVSDSNSRYCGDYWYVDDDGHFGNYNEGEMILKAYVPLAHQDYLDPSLSPNTFIHHISALLPAYHGLHPSDFDRYSPLLHKAVTDMLSIIHSHNEQIVVLHPQALSAFAAGCAHYLVTQISKQDHGETVQQLLLALLRLYPATGEGSTSLKYTIAVTLASSAAAARLYIQVPGLSLRDEQDITHGARLFAKYIHRGAEPSDHHSSPLERLLYFGLLGVSHMLPFASVDSQLVDTLRSGLRYWECGGRDAISLKTLPHCLTWDQLRMQAGLSCLEQIPELNGSLDAENTLAEYLWAVIWHLGPIGLEAGSDQVALDAISAACHARSARLWHCGLNIFGLEIWGKQQLDDHSLHRVTCLQLVERLFVVSTSSNPCSSPQAMKHIWNLVLLILRSTALTPRDRISALGSLLQRSELEESRHLTTTHGLPRSIDDLRLEPIWYAALESMISSGHAPEMDGEIIQVMIEHYSKTEATITNSGEEPATNNRSEILQRWQNLDALFKSPGMKTTQARRRWNVLLIVLKCIVRLRSKRQVPDMSPTTSVLEDTVVTSESDASAV